MIRTDRQAALFQAFKYVVYALLAINVLLFGLDDWFASDVTFADGVSAAQFVEAFSATVDTAAWVLLLLLFELETSVLDDQQIRGKTKWVLHGVRAICYAFIVWAFWGYCAKLLLFLDANAVAGVTSLCALAADGWSFVVTLDEYVAIDAVNCAALSQSVAFWQIGDVGLVADDAGLRTTRWLAWTDVINAGTWLLVVTVLEIDVWLQTRGRFEGAIFRTSYAAKALLYTVLLGAAVFWGLEGDFLDFWDAFLWLLAFAFIELNVFDWHQEKADTAQS